MSEACFEGRFGTVRRHLYRIAAVRIVKSGYAGVYPCVPLRQLAVSLIR